MRWKSKNSIKRKQQQTPCALVLTTTIVNPMYTYTDNNNTVNPMCTILTTTQ